MKKIFSYLLILTFSFFFIHCSSDDGGDMDSGDMDGEDMDTGDPDILQIPDGPLEFIESIVYRSTIGGIIKPQIDMIGSPDNNSIYFAFRDNERKEVVVKYTPETGDLVETAFDNSDFTSKQLAIYNGELYVFGGQFLNVYDLDLTNTPTSQLHGTGVIWFGSAIENEDFFLVGGQISSGEEEADASQILRWNLANEALTAFTNLPEPRFGARSVIIDETMYVFGGFISAMVGEDEPQNTVYKIPLDDAENIEVLNNITPSEFTMARSVKNLIYLAGTNGFFDSEAQRSTISVFNTVDDSYQLLETNLMFEGPDDIIIQMTILNDKMYVLAKQNFTGEEYEYTIYEAPLNHN